MDTKRGKFRLMEFLLFIAAVVFGILTIRSYTGGCDDWIPGDVVWLQEGWYYIVDGERAEVTLPAEIRTEPGKGITLFRDVTDTSLSGMTLSTKGALYDIRIEVRSTDDEDAASLLRPKDTHILFAYQDEAFERNEQMAEKLYCEAVLPLDISGKTIALVFSNSESGVYNISPVYCGTSSEIFGFHFKENAIVILMVVAMFVLSIAAMAVSIYLRFSKMKDCRFMFAALFMLFCGIWCITDLSIVQQLTGLSPITNFVSFTAFMSMPIPMIYFIRTTDEMKRYRILEILVKIFYLNLIVQMALNLLEVYQFTQMLFVTHFLLIGGAALLVGLMLHENQRKPGDDLSTILKAFEIVGLGGFLALALYYTIPNTHYEVIYEGGILIFMIYLLYSVVKEVVSTMKFRAEMMAMQRLSVVDNLTGLGNRSALDSFLVEFEERADACENALMMIFDINKLKNVNDQSGHSAGDEMIISTARCISRVFGDAGHCFRTGGGEFFVILENPSDHEDIWYARLTRELNQYNQLNRNRLMLARGSSFLVEHGVRKGISDWKYDAEQHLYQNKGWRRVDDMQNFVEADQKGRCL